MTLTRTLCITGLLVAVAASLFPDRIHGQAGSVRVRVTDVNDLSAGQRLKIIMRGTLAPRALRGMSPLYAYRSNVVCDSTNPLGNLTEQYGPAALVIENEHARGLYRAVYHRTVRDTVSQAQNWCTNSNLPESQWYIATTFPVDGLTPERQFISMEADRIADYLPSR